MFFPCFPHFGRGPAAPCMQLLGRARSVPRLQHRCRDSHQINPELPAQSRSAELLCSPSSVGEGVISTRADTALGRGIVPLASRAGEHHRAGRVGILLVPTVSHILASPRSDVSVSDCVLPASAWAVAAPGYPRTLADFIWVYPCKSCQPESLLIHADEEGTWILAVDTRMHLPTSLS